jgi:hypothetical protein
VGPDSLGEGGMSGGGVGGEKAVKKTLLQKKLKK